MANDVDITMLDKIESISIIDGCSMLTQKFESEKDFITNLLPKVSTIIKAMYGYDVVSIETEKFFNFKIHGYYNIKYDIFIRTKQGQDIVIECKNPIHEKAETFGAISQIMSYLFIINQYTSETRKPKVILATSRVEFYLFEVMAMFNVKADVILNNERSAAFWINNL